MRLRHVPGHFPDVSKEDVTLYYAAKSSDGEREDYDDLDEHLANSYSNDMQLEFEGHNGPLSCRGLACRCLNGAAIAVTLRGHPLSWTSRKGDDCFKEIPAMTSQSRSDMIVSILSGGTPTESSYDHLAISDAKPHEISFRRLRSSFSTSSSHSYPKGMVICRDQARKVAATSSQHSSGVDLHRAPVKGLIVVAGETGSGKSYLADGILRRILWLRSAPSPVRHVIALGRPVDWSPGGSPDHKNSDCPLKWDASALQSCHHKYRIQYTPRTIGIDTTLNSALVDALRQKPTAVYLDEVRSGDDWPAVLRFAESGHLIVTTTHAGSVADTIWWILRSCGITRRSQAPSILRSIVGVVHNEHKYPELWVGSLGTRLWAAYGPGSLVPQNDCLAEYVSRGHLRSQNCEAYEPIW